MLSCYQKANYNSGRLLVNSEAKVVGNEAVSVVGRGQVVDGVAGASLHDVGVNVEVSEESKHEEHVARQEELAPAWELTLDVDTVHWVRKSYEELYLNAHNTDIDVSK